MTAKTIKSLKELSTGRTDGFKVDPLDILIDMATDFRLESEMKAAHIEWLAENILEIGQLQPIKVVRRETGWFAVDGRCRLRALWLLKDRGHDVKAWVINAGKYVNDVDELIQQAMSNTNIPFTMLEFGGLFAAMIQRGMNEADVAKKVSKSEVYVRNCLRLHSSPFELREKVQSGDVAPSLVLELKREGNSDSEIVEKLSEAAAIAKETGAKRVTKKHVKTLQQRRDQTAAATEARQVAHREKAEKIKAMVDADKSITVEMIEGDHADHVATIAKATKCKVLKSCRLSSTHFAAILNRPLEDKVIIVETFKMSGEIKRARFEYETALEALISFAELVE